MKIRIRGKDVKFSSRTLKGGVAYYRDGKRAKGAYQIRVAKGVLSGESLLEARGHPFGKYSGKLLTKRQILEQEEFHLGQWAETPSAKGRGKERAVYYMKIRVKSDKYEKIEGIACTIATLQMRDPFHNNQEGFTRSELAKNFGEIAMFTLGKYGLEPCTGRLQDDIINIWRHARR